MDNRSNSRANTCPETATPRGSSGLIRLKANPACRFLVNHNNFTNRMALCWRWVIQVSALSAVMLVYWTNMAKTGDGGLGSDSGEGA